MESSLYKIIGKRGGGCKIFFTDRRMDKFRRQIYEIFDMMDAVDGSYVPTPEDFINGEYQKNIDRIENIKRKTEDCRHKATAARYSLALIEQEISNRPSDEDMKKYSEMIAHNMCDKAELKNDVLIYETEAFLFQVRTNIDILVQLLKYIPEYNYLEYTGKKRDNEAFVFCNKRKTEENTTNKMRASGHEEIANFFDKHVDEWIQDLNKMRNEIAHRSGLKGFTSFVFDSGEGKVVHPQMPNGKKVDKYCTEVFDRLLLLYKKIFQDFILPKF